MLVSYLNEMRADRVSENIMISICRLGMCKLSGVLTYPSRSAAGAWVSIVPADTHKFYLRASMIERYVQGSHGVLKG